MSEVKSKKIKAQSTFLKNKNKTKKKNLRLLRDLFLDTVKGLLSSMWSGENGLNMSRDSTMKFHNQRISSSPKVNCSH